MNLYLIGIIAFSIVLIICILLYIYFSKDEKNLNEVSPELLQKYGKTYSKQEFEDKMFEVYTNILLSNMNENYSYLKDVMADEEYNKTLLNIKNNKDNNLEYVIKNIQKNFCKLISFQVTNELEIAKFWIKYSAIEYTKTIDKNVNADGSETLNEVVTSGNINNKNNYQYILTFVKNKTNGEDIICPSCGYQTHILTSSKCIRCESEIIPKKMHWVYFGKEVTDIIKTK